MSADCDELETPFDPPHGLIESMDTILKACGAVARCALHEPGIYSSTQRDVEFILDKEGDLPDEAHGFQAKLKASKEWKARIATQTLDGGQEQ